MGIQLRVTTSKLVADFCLASLSRGTSVGTGCRDCALFACLGPMGGEIAIVPQGLSGGGLV